MPMIEYFHSAHAHPYTRTRTHMHTHAHAHAHAHAHLSPVVKVHEACRAELCLPTLGVVKAVHGMGKVSLMVVEPLLLWVKPASNVNNDGAGVKHRRVAGSDNARILELREEAQHEAGKCLIAVEGAIVGADRGLRGHAVVVVVVVAAAAAAAGVSSGG